MTCVKEENLVKLFFPASTLNLAAVLSLCKLSVFVKMGTCEEINEWSSATRKGHLPRGGENLLEFPIETAVNISDELPESAEIETIGNCRGPDLSFCTENVPI